MTHTFLHFSRLREEHYRCFAEAKRLISQEKSEVKSGQEPITMRDQNFFAEKKIKCGIMQPREQTYP